ncbi:MAG TPA: ABC transporter permease subunit [Thermoanaerobaculia bacterium]|nr:ABC transporter permease subunit [Thermoanaerobaculia bacterium]
MSPSSSSRLGSGETPRRRLLADRLARWIVSAGGLAIIFSVLGILVFILLEVWPLTTGARVGLSQPVPLAGPRAGALLADEHRTHVAALGEDGLVRVVRTRDGAVTTTLDLLAQAQQPGQPPGEAPVREPQLLTDMDVPAGSQALAAATRDGRVLIAPIRFEITFEGQNRVVAPAIDTPVSLVLDPAGRPLRAFAAQLGDDGGATAAAVLADGSLAIVRRTAEENLMTGEVTESLERFQSRVPGAGEVADLVMDRDRRNLYGGTTDGKVLWWSLEGEPGDPQVTSAGPSPVTAAGLLIGGRSLVVGQEDGSVSVWFQVRQPDETYRLTRVRDFPALTGPVRAIAASQRDRSFLVYAANGRMGLYHSTAHRTLWTGEVPVEGGTSLAYTPKADGAYLAGGGKLEEIRIHNPHPEVTWKSLFGKTWYEGADKPEYVWQSSSGTDDFEPKLSLTPLLAGTLKGTFYSLLLAIPLGVFGAMYASQFMHPAYKRYLKPLIEIMASLPSVVLGFLAGLWLAPRVEQAMPGLILMLIVLPLFVLAAGFLWRSLPRTFRGRFRVGTEAILFIFVLAFGIWVCFQLSEPFERLVFGGNFQGWLLDATGLNYDQRNAVVVGLAMGFAVIPIIFAIAEDAFSNVPPNLVAGSLALGADRWQTVTRVVLPTASPGIFSAIMVGFGRAVGETMIVLMATGNTPIMEWNPFNGFRTLSANIAVEIPEAPQGGTLYRTLFLAALLLFIATFIINTVAELVRQRLRERYSQL